MTEHNKQFYGLQSVLQVSQWPTAILLRNSQHSLPRLNMGVMCAMRDSA